MFCAINGLAISWQHLNYPNLLVRSVYSIYVYFDVRIILHHLGISLPHEDDFNKVKNSCVKMHDTVFVIVNADEAWIKGDWFYRTKYDIFGNRENATKQPYTMDNYPL